VYLVHCKYGMRQDICLHPYQEHASRKTSPHRRLGFRHFLCHMDRHWSVGSGFYLQRSRAVEFFRGQVHRYRCVCELHLRDEYCCGSSSRCDTPFCLEPSPLCWPEHLYFFSIYGATHVSSLPDLLNNHLTSFSIVIAIAVELHFANSYATSPDYTYDHWQTVLCVQIAQNLSVISACLPCLCPFILNILSGETKLMPVRKEYKPNAPACRIGRHLKGWCPETFDPMSSDTSELPLKEKTDDEYCKPLATWGLDKGSVHLQTQSNRLPANGKNVATTVQELKPPQDIFMRRVSTPMSMRTDSVRRPGTSHSHSKELPPVPAIPKSLAQVGVLPSSGWDADSNDSTQGNDSPNLNSIFSERGRSDSPSSLRHRDSEYIFKRSNVISVPEDHAFFEQEYWKKYPPPPLSPPVIRDGREMRFPR
jgi:hypothetical protein